MRKMKKLIVVLTLVAFGFVASVTAEDGQCPAKEKAGEKGCCPAGGKKKEGCPKDGEKGCPAKEKAPESK